ncbi:MAG: hypothetical protein M0C28_10610 [Candidatus Moduliflexus flocculans]|nr:hypothetical protein [Candidatus Moduliflexus flocculans]
MIGLIIGLSVVVINIIFTMITALAKKTLLRRLIRNKWNPYYSSTSTWLQDVGINMTIVFSTLFVVLLLSVLSFLATRRLQVYPGRLQNVMEVIVGWSSFTADRHRWDNTARNFSL